MNKIKKLTEKEEIKWDALKEMDRGTKISSILTDCFEKSSVRKEDEEHIFNWASGLINGERLIYLMEKKKKEVLGR